MDRPLGKEATTEIGKFKLILRICLMCRKNFESEWAGERICHKCKSTEAWRRG